MKPRLYCSLTLCIMLTGIMSATALELTRPQTGGLPICIPADADRTLVYAAEELQGALKRITGADFSIQRTDVLPEAGAIVIGVDRGNHAANDTLRVFSDEHSLHLTGNNSRSALYAVYAFLNRYGGMQWLWPGADGEFFTARPDFQIPEIDLTESAAFRYRGFHLCNVHIDPETETWMARNRLNLIRSPAPDQAWVDDLLQERKAKGLHLMISGHNIILGGEDFRSNPELFAIINGIRTKEQLCWSNPEAFRRLVEYFTQTLAGYPEVEIVSLFPADNTDFCRCDQCAKVDVSTGWFDLYSRLTQALRPALPKLKFASIAYSGYGSPPATSPEEAEFIEYCMYNRCYVHPFGHRNCTINERALQALEEWRATSVPLMIYGYEFDIFNQAMHVPFYTMIADEMRRFRDLGIIGVFPETYPMNYRPHGDESAAIPYNHNRLAYYLYAKSLWNPDLDDREVVREFSKTAFDAAGEAMGSYFTLLADAWDAMETHYSHYGASPLACAELFLTNDTEQRARQALEHASAAADTISDAALRDRVKREIATEAGILQLWIGFRDSYLAAKANLKLIVPRAAHPGDFTGAATLPAFKTAGAAPAPSTAIQVNYDDKALYFDIVCDDPDPANRVARRTEHDSDVWADEVLELFISVPEDTLGIYRHFAVNRLSGKYDAVALGGAVFNHTGFNPEWEVQTTDGGSRWHTQITLPFIALGRTPLPGELWRFTIKRSNGGRSDLPNSGFPDAGYHDLNAFGMMQFSSAARSNPLSLITGKRERPELEVMTELGNADFQVRAATDWQNIDQDAVIIVRTPELSWEQLGDADKLKDALQRGAVVIFSGYGDLPLEQLFHDPALAVSWSGWDIATDRATAALLPGTWSTEPCDIAGAIYSLSAPSSGYRPVYPEGWLALAELKMQDGSQIPYLLARRIGRGLLVVTGADLGLAGGTVFLGSGVIHTIPMLLKNLQHNFTN